MQRYLILIFLVISVGFATPANLLYDKTQRWDLTLDNPDTAVIPSQKTIIEVAKIAKNVDKVLTLMPRVTKTGTCSDTGCSLDTAKCNAIYEDPVCPSGSVLNKSRDMCQKDPDIKKCPINDFVYDQTLDKCIKSVVCPGGGTYILSRQRCEYKRIYECPSGYTEQNGICIAPPICPSGAKFDTTRNRCEMPITLTCPSNWTLNNSSLECEKTPVCSSGTYSTTLNKCIISASISCASGYSYNSSRGRCERNPDCPSGSSYNASTNKCETYSGSTITVTEANSESACLRSQSHLISESPSNQWSIYYGKCCACAGSGVDLTITKTNTKNYNLSFKLRADYAWTQRKSLNITLGSDKNGEIPTYLGYFRWDRNNRNITYSFNNNILKVYFHYGRDYGGFKIDFNTAVYYKLDCKNPSNAIAYADLENMPVCKGCGSDLDSTVLTQTWLPNLNTYGWKLTYNNGGTLYLELSSNKSKVFYRLTAGRKNKEITTNLSETLKDKLSGLDINSNKYNFFIDFELTKNYLKVGGKSSTQDLSSLSDFYQEIYTFDDLLCYISSGCPSGYTAVNGICSKYTNPTCPSGGSFDGIHDKCYLSLIHSCPSGMTYDSSNSVCVENPNCDGGTLNTGTDLCSENHGYSCPSGGTQDVANQVCSFITTCVGDGSPSGSNCKADKIPLHCQVGTDTTLDVCYSHINDCLVSSSYPDRNTLSYSIPLEACLVKVDLECAADLSWTASEQKCEAVPICIEGVYNPDNNKCFNEDYSCPTNPNLSCTGPSMNKWCSPWKCNSDNQCGYAYCMSPNQPSNIPPWMGRELLNNIQYISNNQCTGDKCDIVTNRDISYCGGYSCPKGFGVYEKNGKCYVDACPNGTEIGNDGKCYESSCPEGTTEQGDGTCL